MVSRGLRRLPPFKDYLFRAVTFLTISVIAVGFGLSHNPPANPSKGQGEYSQASPQRDFPETFWEKLAEDPTAFFTMVLALLTATLAAGSIAQIYFLLSADRTTRLAARAAVKSAEVAARTVKSIEDTAERQLRAYVGIERVYISQSAVSGKLMVTIITKNSGQTPAYKHVSQINIGIALDTATLMHIDQSVKPASDQAALMPGATLEIVLSKDNLSPEIIAAAQAGSIRVGIVGRITYEDVFGRPRMTQIKMFSRDKAVTFAFASDGNVST